MLVTLHAALAPAANAAAELASKKVEPTTLDWVGAVGGFVTLGVGGAVLVGMGCWMIYKALTASQDLSTSWSQPQESTFEPFAQVDKQLHGRSWTFALAGAALLGVLALGVYFGVAPQKDKSAESMDMSTFDRKAKAPDAK